MGMTEVGGDPTWVNRVSAREACLVSTLKVAWKYLEDAKGTEAHATLELLESALKDLGYRFDRRQQEWVLKVPPEPTEGGEPRCEYPRCLAEERRTWKFRPNAGWGDWVHTVDPTAPISSANHTFQSTRATSEEKPRSLGEGDGNRHGPQNSDANRVVEGAADDPPESQSTPE